LRPAAKLLCVLLAGASPAIAADVYFGTPVPDPYRWLEVSSAPATEAWTFQQNQKTDAYFASLPSLAMWHDRLAKATPAERLVLPKLTQNPERPSVPPSALGLEPAPRQWFPSPDGKTIIYSSHPLHTDLGALHVRNLQTHEENPDEVILWENYGDVAWSADSQGFYYLAVSSALSDTARVAAATIRYHKLGQPSRNDQDIFPATQDPSHYLIPQTSADGHWLVVSVAQGFSGTSVYARDLTRAATDFYCIFKSTTATASVQMHGGKFYALTNRQAPTYEVMVSSGLGLPWHVLIPAAPQSVWDALAIFGDQLVLTRVRQAASELVICSLEGTACKTVPLPVGSIEEMEGSPTQDNFYIRFESFFIPPQIYHVSAKARQAAVWKISLALKAPWISEQVHFLSTDRTSIPMWILHAKNFKKDRSYPAILTGYGGFNVSMTPRYQAAVVAWLEAGGIMAIPLLRGGGEFGEAWHAAGSGQQKQHTFDDMIAAAQFLIREGYTQSEKLAIQGGSNGGLTVAAVITQHPELFRAAILKNPLTDMIRYPLFGEGPAWISEYGSPQKADDFRALWSYSPYHHVRDHSAYPAVLVLSAEVDDRVAPLHARKFAAALQRENYSSHPILFQTLKNVGHYGPDSTEADTEEWTNRLLFLGQELVL